MSSESPEETTLEVLDLPPGVDEELLTLYFENKRRSGGGPLVSVEKKGDARILVFEEAEAAARVLSRGHHVLQNVELSVRKPACKDKCRLLLRGVSPNTSTEMVELFVENMMGLNLPDYTLHPAPGRDCILIHLSQPFSKDFQTLSTKISKRTLDGAKVTLEQIEQADSVLVENLHPGTTPDLLTLYFESRGGGGQTVKDAMMLSEGTAKVSFVNPDSVSLVLDHSHKLEGVDLVVRPYFDFLQPTQTPQDTQCGSHDMTDSEGLSDVQTSPTDVDANNTSSSHLTLEAHAVPSLETSQEVAEDQLDDKDVLSEHIAVTDPVKLSLFQLGTFQQETENSHTNVTIQIKDDGLHVAATDRQTFERRKQSILEYFGQMAKTDFTLEPEEAEFLKRKDVKERLEQSLNHTPAVYTVLDSNVVVTALSQKSANQACSFLKLQLGRFSIAVDSQHESMLYCREWSEFLQALSFSSVKVSERGENIDVLTLKGMESEKQAAILEFLSAPIERETVISMEPGMLKYIQTHCHQLLADMTEVSIFPLESDDVYGLKLHGPAVACQMAEEVIQGMLSSIYTKTITISAPGITRYLGEEECKKIMNEMERKFQVYIIIKHVPWEPLQDQDIFQTAWTMMSNINFPKVSVDVSAQKIKSNSVQTNRDGAACRDLLEEAKTDFSPTHDLLTEGVAGTDQLCDFDNVDLYTAEEPISFTEQFFDAPQVSTSELLSLKGDLSGEIEDAQLSLAIQYSMEASQWTLEDEEEQVQKALELSMKMIQNKASSCDTDRQVGRAVVLEETIKAANTIQLVVFALYSCDIFRVDIAFSKKVNQGQVEDKLEHQSLKNMTEYHKKCLEMIKRKHGVEIQIQGTIITISGFRNFVSEALCDVKLLLEKMSNSVSDQEILGTVQWVYHDPVSSDTTPYSPDAIVFIENVWKMKLEKIDILLDNQRHTINFVKMQQYNVASGTSGKISRKLLNTGDLDANIPEEYSSLLSNLPDATRVDEDSDEFQNVVQKFYETIQEYHNKIRIVQVEKLMNRLLCSQYKLKKASVLQNSTCPEVERTLYHGTSEASVKEICVHGFNRSFCGKNATVYGQGVYFAVNSALSVQNLYSPPNADGYKFIFVSKVLTGDYTKGCHSMKTAPHKESGGIPLRYDSVTDNISKPTMFVIFNDTQAFPEYLITCQRIH